MQRYLYAVVRSAMPGPDVRGIEDAAVEHAYSGELGVLWSRITAERVRARRVHLKAHDRVLRAAMAAGAAIPLRFGTTADDEEGAELAFLKRCDRTALLERLDALEGQVQVVLSYEPDEGMGLERIVRRFPELRNSSRVAIDRGREIAAALQELAVQDLSRIASALCESATEIGEIEPRGSMARLSLLVSERGMEGFLAEADVLRAEVAPAGRLHAIGGLPPYSFTGLEAGAGSI